MEFHLGAMVEPKLDLEATGRALVTLLLSRQDGMQECNLRHEVARCDSVGKDRNMNLVASKSRLPERVSGGVMVTGRGLR